MCRVKIIMNDVRNLKRVVSRNELNKLFNFWDTKCIKFRDETTGETSILVSILDTRNA